MPSPEKHSQNPPPRPKNESAHAGQQYHDPAELKGSRAKLQEQILTELTHKFGEDFEAKRVVICSFYADVMITSTMSSDDSSSEEVSTMTTGCFFFFFLTINFCLSASKTREIVWN